MSESVVEERYALRHDVIVVRRSQSLLLFSRATGRSVRLSSATVDLLPMLQDGASFEQLRRLLRDRHPAATDIEPKLWAFLGTLAASRVLHGEAVAGGPPARQPGKYALFAADPVARVLARPLRVALPGPLGKAAAIMLSMAAVTAIAVLALRHGLPTPRFLAEHLSAVGLLVFVLVVAPLHELSHAVACRLAGVQAGRAGVMLHARLIPGPYVETNQTYLLTDRWRRFLIPAAGPFIDLLSAGIAAALLCLHAPADWAPALRTVLFACLLFVYFDTNPFAASDGSHCIEALLEDELARRQALAPRRLQRTPDTRAARRYRACALAHLAIATALFAAWVFS